MDHLGDTPRGVFTRATVPPESLYVDILSPVEMVPDGKGRCRVRLWGGVNPSTVQLILLPEQIGKVQVGMTLKLRCGGKEYLVIPSEVPPYRGNTCPKCGLAAECRYDRQFDLLEWWCVRCGHEWDTKTKDATL